MLSVYSSCRINERMAAATIHSDTKNQSTSLHSIAIHRLSQFVSRILMLTATDDSIIIRARLCQEILRRAE
jgi:hypothetical protein